MTPTDKYVFIYIYIGVSTGEAVSSLTMFPGSLTSISLRKTTRRNYLGLIETIWSLIVLNSSGINKVAMTWGNLGWDH